MIDFPVVRKMKEVYKVGIYYLKEEVIEDEIKDKVNSIKVVSIRVEDFI